MESTNVFFGGIICAMVFGVIVGSVVSKNDMEQKAVKANVAYYDTKTKEFKFITLENR